MQVEDLRKKVEDAGGIFMIAKNTLLKLAEEKSNVSRDLEQAEILKGPTATLFCTEDETSPIKALVDFAKEWELPTVKGGFLQKEFLSANQLQILAKLPGRQVLLSHVKTTIKSPLFSLVNILNVNLYKLICALNNVKDKRI